MAAPADFAKLVPGFDFLQGLVKNAGAALPGMGQWIAPTLDPDELDKRIDQLKTVQFWLEQNARMIGATVQALEVQRMTLSTLRTMNLPVADVAEAFKARPPAPAVEPQAAPAAAAARKRASRRAGAPAAAEPGPNAGVVDPMKWWAALTDQFAHVASNALKEIQPAGQSAAPGAGASSPASKPAATPKKGARRGR
jgi:hypothetical protein